MVDEHFSVFGKKLTPPGAGAPPAGEVDFRWEREWRYPSSRGNFQFGAEDVFICLCPHEEIEEFEGEYPGFSFIDPTRNMKWYASKLIERRQHFDLKHSVV